MPMEPVPRLPESSERETDRLRLLLDVNDAVVSHLDLQDLLQAIAAYIRRSIPHEVTGLAIYDEQIEGLRLQVVEGLGEKPSFPIGSVLPLAGTAGGRAFLSGEVLL